MDKKNPTTHYRFKNPLSFHQSQGATFHARFNRGNCSDKSPVFPGSALKPEETLLLLAAIIDLITAEAEAQDKTIAGSPEDVSTKPTCYISEAIARKKRANKRQKEKYHGHYA